MITQIKLWILVTLITNTAPILTLGAPIHILTAPLLTLSALTAIRGCWDHFQNWQDSKMHTKMHTRVCVGMSWRRYQWLKDRHLPTRQQGEATTPTTRVTMVVIPFHSRTAKCEALLVRQCWQHLHPAALTVQNPQS